MVANPWRTFVNGSSVPAPKFSNNLSNWLKLCNDCNVRKNENYTAKMFFRSGALRVRFEIWYELSEFHTFLIKRLFNVCISSAISLIFLFKFCIFLYVDAIKTDATWRASQTMQSSQQPHHGNFTNHCWCWYVKLYIWCLIIPWFINHKS